MAVKVKRYRVRAGDKIYVPGDIILTLTKKEEQELIENGCCESMFIYEQFIPNLSEEKEEADQEIKNADADADEDSEDVPTDAESNEGETLQEEGPITDLPVTADTNTSKTRKK